MTNDDQVVVTIIHGDMETEAEVRSLEAVRHSIDPYWVKTQGTNDTTTYVLRRAGVQTMMRTIRAHRRSWWKVSIQTEVMR